MSSRSENSFGRG